MNAAHRPRRFDLIAFDWDGTLFDSTAIIVRSIQAAVRDVGGATPSDRDAAYVIGMALTQALAHAAPDVPPEKYPELNLRYRYHYARHQDDLSLFDGVLPLLAGLREPVDAFFEEVLVNADDLAVRANRYALLAKLRGLFLGVADISLLG